MEQFCILLYDAIYIDGNYMVLQIGTNIKPCIALQNSDGNIVFYSDTYGTYSLYDFQSLKNRYQIGSVGVSITFSNYLASYDVTSLPNYSSSRFCLINAYAVSNTQSRFLQYNIGDNVVHMKFAEASATCSINFIYTY